MEDSQRRTLNSEKKGSFIITTSGQNLRKYGYGHLSPADQQMVDAILRGKKPLERLPDPDSRVIRLFISSTFTDTEEERNYLLPGFSELAHRCRERYGIEFHVLDMRWGIPPEAKYDHKAADLCLQEIRNSHKSALGPHFLAFLGHKYGYVDLPSTLQPHEFEAIRFELVQKYDTEKVKLLQEWYKKDVNENPPEGVYILQPVDSVLGEEVLQLADSESPWRSIEKQLHELLTEGTELAVSQENLPEQFLQHLTASITEKEIQAGGMDLPPQLSHNLSVLCVVRTIPDIHDNLSHPLARKFIDMMPKPIKNKQTTSTPEVLIIDKNKQSCLERLREERFVPKLDPGNVIEYSVGWNDLAMIKKGCLQKIDWSKQPFSNTATRLLCRLESLVDANVRKHKRDITTDFLYRDVLEHWLHAKQMMADTGPKTGRDLELTTIGNYIMSDEASVPLVVHGAEGTGKSVVIAKAATEVSKHHIIAGNMHRIPPIILRFCGLTPQCSTTRQLLQSLCHQIAYVTSRPRQYVPVDYKKAISYFRTFLQKGAEGTNKVVILITRFDELTKEDNISVIDWLPLELSPKVKLILSTGDSGNAEKTLGKLSKKFKTELNFIELKELKAEKCSEIIHALLESRGKQLTPPQWQLVENAFAQCSLPLFVKLTLEEVLKWKSYARYDMNNLSTCVTGCINSFFAHIEKKHGKPLVAKVISYITASGEGISETELEHVCSIDDPLLDQVFQFWDRPIRRLPSMLLMRLKHDINVYLIESNLDNTTVIYWRYLPFCDAAKELYLSDSHDCKQIHWNMSDYYMGIWSHKAKPYRVGDSDKFAFRYVPKQPLTFDQSEMKAKERFNLRKLNQLPYHLAEAGRHLTLNTQVFFNFDWICTKLKATSVQKIITDYSLIDRPEVRLVADALRMCETALTEDPDVIGVELAGRLLPFYKTHPDIRQLIVQCDKAAETKCPIIPNFPVYQAPGGPLQYTCEMDTKITGNFDFDVIQNDDTVMLTAKPYYGNRMRVWDIALGESIDDVAMPVESTVHPTPDGSLIHLIEKKRYLLTYRFNETFHGDTEPQSRIDFGHGNIDKVEVSNRYVAITKQHSKSPILIDTREGKILTTCAYTASKVIISQDETYMLTHNENTLLLHSMPSVTLRAVAPGEVKPIKLLFTSNNLRFYALDENHELRSYNVSLKSGTANATGVIKDPTVRDFVLSHSENRLLVQSDRCLYLFDPKTDRLVHRIDKMPASFKQKMTTFKAARFNSTDTLVIAARHTYIATWDVETANPLHAFQTSVSPVNFFYTCDERELAVSIHDDSSVHVWNVNNLTTEKQHFNGVLRSSMKCMAVSDFSDKIICCGTRFPEAFIIKVSTMETLCTVTHSDDAYTTISDVIMSPTGNFAITRMVNSDNPDGIKPWPLLRSDKLWDATNGQCRLNLSSNRYVRFTPDGSHLVCIHCKTYSTYNWDRIQYDLIVFSLASNRAKATNYLDLPFGDIIGEPITSESGKYFCFLLQVPTDRKIFSPDRKEETVTTEYSVKLFVYDFKDEKRGLQPFDIDPNEGKAEQNLVFIDVQPLSGNRILLMAGTAEKGHITHNADGTIHIGDIVPMQCMIYSFNSYSVLVRYNTNWQAMTARPSISSRRHTCTMDHAGHIYDMDKSDVTSNQVLSTVDMSNVAKNGVVLILDGKYAAILLSNRSEIIVVSTLTGKRLAHAYIHGTALHIYAAVNDRTLVIACKDGRILVFSVVLELGDPLEDYIKELPSRQIPVHAIHPFPNVKNVIKSADYMQRGKLLLKVPEATTLGFNPASPISPLYHYSPKVGEEQPSFQINGASIDIQPTRSVYNDRMKEAIITRSKIEEHKRKFPSMKAVGKAITIAQSQTNKSRACVIQ